MFDAFAEFEGRQTTIKNFVRNRNGKLETVYRNISTTEGETFIARFEFTIPTISAAQTETYKSTILTAIDEMEDNTSVFVKELVRKTGVTE